MDSLTQKGLKYINENKEFLGKFAEKIFKEQMENPEGNLADAGEDVWVMLSNKGNIADSNQDELEDCIDLNIWLDDETRSWKAAVYPLMYVSTGEVQTNGQYFVNLW